MLDLARIPVLETERLRLRRPVEADLDALATMYADPLFMRYIGTGQPRSRGDTWYAIASILGHWALRGYGLLAVEEKATGALVGRIGLLNPEGWPGIELAWGIARGRWGEGLAPEGAAAVRDWAFAERRLPRLISLIHPDNAGSIRVAEKLGARFEGTWDFAGLAVKVYAIERGARP